MKSLFLGLFFGLFLFLGCSQTPLSPEGAQTSPPLAAHSRLFSHLYLGAAPDEAEMARLKQENFQALIDLRAPEEGLQGQRQQAKKLGLTYKNIPFARGIELKKAPFARISSLIRQWGNKKIYLFCASGNRASAWLAFYASQQLHYTPADAVALAKKVGLKSAEMEQKLNDFLLP